MLELKSLLIGLFLAVGVFAVKTGAGLSYFVVRRTTIRRKISVLFLVAASYFSIFFLSWYLCSRIDVVVYFNELRAFFQSGMMLHFIVAAGMIIWGVSLLRRNPKDGEHGSWGWLALVIPCPVCGSVIFFTTGFLVSLFPDDSLRAVLGSYALFVGIMLATLVALTAVSRFAFHLPEQMLAVSMLFIASYFIMSVLLVPHFSDVHKVYRIAAYQASEGSVDLTTLAGLVAGAAAAISTGFISQVIKQRSVR